MSASEVLYLLPTSLFFAGLHNQPKLLVATELYHMAVITNNFSNKTVGGLVGNVEKYSAGGRWKI